MCEKFEEVSHEMLPWPCLWGKLQNLPFWTLAKQVVMSFCAAGVVLPDIHGRFVWQAQYFCVVFRQRVALFVAGATLSRLPSSVCVPGAKFTCVVLHSTLPTLHSTLHTFTLHPTLHTFTLHSALYTLHSTLHTLHFKLHTLHFKLHTLHFKLHTPHFTLHILHSTLCTPHSTLHTSHFILHTLHSTLYTPHYTLHFTLHTLHSTLHNSHFTLYTLLCPLDTPFSSHSRLCTPPLPHATVFTVHWYGNRGITGKKIHKTIQMICLTRVFYVTAFGFVGCIFLQICRWVS